MRKYFLSCFEKMFLGGGETYYFRLVDIYSSIGFESLLLLPTNSNIEKDILNEINARNIRIVYFDHDLKCDLTFINPGDHIVSIEFTLERFLFIRDTFRRYNCKITIQNYFYVLWWGRGILEKDNLICRKFMKMIAKPLLLSNAYIALDNETQEISSRYMGVNMNEIPIVRLGIETKKRKSFSKKDFIVLSVCRFDFPFKEYILGLIEDYKTFSDNKKQTELWIVGHGESEKEVVDLINKINCSTVKYLGKKEYSELKELYRKSSVYVGMGTTVLEAIENDNIAVVASAYQTKNYSSGFFGDTNFLGGPVDGRFSQYFDSDICKKYRFIDLLNKAFEMSTDEIQTLKNKAWKLYIEYDIRKCIAFFNSHDNGKILDTCMIEESIYKLFLLRYKMRISRFIRNNSGKIDMNGEK